MTTKNVIPYSSCHSRTSIQLNPLSVFPSLTVGQSNHSFGNLPSLSIGQWPAIFSLGSIPWGKRLLQSSSLSTSVNNPSFFIAIFLSTSVSKCVTVYLDWCWVQSRVSFQSKHTLNRHIKSSDQLLLCAWYQVYLACYHLPSKHCRLICQ